MRTAFFTKTLVTMTGALGRWFFSVTVWIITTGYFLIFPRRVVTGIRFYRILFRTNPQAIISDVSGGSTTIFPVFISTV